MRAWKREGSIRGWMGGRVDGWMDRRTDEKRKDRWTDRRTEEAGRRLGVRSFIHTQARTPSRRGQTRARGRLASPLGFLLPQLQASGGPAVWTGLSLPPRKLSQPTGTELHFRQETPALAQGCNLRAVTQQVTRDPRPALTSEGSAPTEPMASMSTEGALGAVLALRDLQHL